MASEAGFSVERLQRFGSEAVRKERRRQEIGHAVTLSCEYLGVSTGEGRFEPAAAAQASHHVGFEWHATAVSYTRPRCLSERAALRKIARPLKKERRERSESRWKKREDRMKKREKRRERRDERTERREERRGKKAKRLRLKAKRNAAAEEYEKMDYASGEGVIQPSFR